MSNQSTEETGQVLWTHARFKYEFFRCLTKIKDPNKSNSVTDSQHIFLTDYKYYSRARKLLYWIPISRPDELVPPFIFNISDLTPRIKKEFTDYCELNNEKEIGIFLKEIATKFFEVWNYNYTHDSVLPHLIVELRD